MKIAIPTANGKLAMHFGHCETFALVNVNDDNTIAAIDTLQPPPHEPGVLPRWLGEQNVDIIIAGGMGQRAQQLFANQGIKVLVGAPAAPVKELVTSYLDGSLQTGANVCDH